MAVLLPILVALFGSCVVAGTMFQSGHLKAAIGALVAPFVAWTVGWALELRGVELLNSAMVSACCIGSICLAIQRRWIVAALFSIPTLALAIRTYMGDQKLHLDHQILFAWVRGIAEFGSVFAPLWLSLAAVFLIGTLIERRPAGG